MGYHAARLETRGTEYRLFTTAHISKLKRVRKFPDRSDNELSVYQEDQVDFDECPMPKDSWVRGSDEGDYEFGEILESRTGKTHVMGDSNDSFSFVGRGKKTPPGWMNLI